MYSDNFIEKVVFRVKPGEITVQEDRKIYGIGGNMTAQRWLNLIDINPKKDTGYKMPVKKKLTPSKWQKQPLKEAGIKLEYYETLFSLAKEEYGFDLKKFWHQAVLNLRKNDKISVYAN
jgi:hypothetical protein